MVRVLGQQVQPLGTMKACRTSGLACPPPQEPVKPKSEPVAPPESKPVMGVEPF